MEMVYVMQIFNRYYITLATSSKTKGRVETSKIKEIFLSILLKSLKRI